MTRHRPAFTGQRLFVLDWQVEDLTRMLGQHTEAFDLFAWFLALDHEMAGSPDILPPQPHQWLAERTFAEARRRGLPVAQATRFGKFSTRLLNALHNNRKVQEP